MKVREIILESDADVKHKLAFRSGKQQLADRANSFGFLKGKGLVRYDAVGKATPFKPMEALKLTGGTAYLKAQSSVGKAANKLLNGTFAKAFYILLLPIYEWSEDMAGVNGLLDAGAFPQATAKQDAQDLRAYYTHICMSKVASGYPSWLAGAVASKVVMKTVVAFLGRGVKGKVLGFLLGSAAQVAVLAALRTEAVQNWLISSLMYFGADAADFGGDWLGSFIPPAWKNFDVIDFIMKMVKGDSSDGGAPTTSNTTQPTPAATQTAAPATATAQSLIKQLG
jgi:hypothetical protein